MLGYSQFFYLSVSLKTPIGLSTFHDVRQSIIKDVDSARLTLVLGFGYEWVREKVCATMILKCKVALNTHTGTITT